MGFDVSGFDKARQRREDGIEIAIVDPATGDKTDAIIVVASYSSERVRARARSISDEWEKQRRKDPQFMPGLDEQERFAKAMARAAIIGWRGLTEEGKEWPFTAENIDRLLSEPTIAKQIDRAAGDEAAFFTG